MKSADSLHELIQALSKSEKRYFKVSVARNGTAAQQKYVALFDLLAEMDRFDKERIQTKMAWTNFRASYSMAKRYLQDKILQVLEAYESEDPSKKKLLVYLSQINILMDKQLHRQAGKKIQQAKRFAKRIENHTKLFEILKLERRLLIRHRKSLFEPQALRALNEEIQEALLAVEMEEKAHKIHYHFFTVLNSRGGLSKEQGNIENDAMLDELYSLKLLSRPYFKAKVHHFSSLNQYHYLNRNFEASKNALGASLQLYTSNPVMQKEYLANYMADLNNYASRCILLEDYASVLESIEAIRQIKTQNRQLETQRMESFLVMSMAMVRNSGEFKNNKHVLDLAVQVIEDPKTALSTRFALNVKMHIAAWYFCEGNCELALRWLTELSRIDEISSIPYYDRLIAAVEILIQYELGNLDLLEYQLRNRLENIKSQALFDFEKVFYLYLRKLIRAKDAGEIVDASQGFLESLKQIEEAPSETIVFTFFEFGDWAESKLRGETIIEVIQRTWLERGGIPVLFG